jgi:hypothetical protein
VRKIVIHAQTQTFASYMHASNFEENTAGGNIWFGTGEVIDGDVYSNDQLNILGTPRILGYAQSAAATVNYSGGGTEATFEGGHYWGAPQIYFNTDAQGNPLDYVADVKSYAESGGLVLTGNYTIEFFSNGKYAYRPSGGGAAITNNLSSINGAIYVSADATVKGQVNGNVTVAAESDIFIADDIIYASAQSPSPYDAGYNPAVVDDSLGLIAKSSVVVQGTTEIAIDAAIMVTNGNAGFGAENHADDLGEPRIKLYGSLSQYRRGVIGHSDGTGFRKNYKYDSRMRDAPPPFFPDSAYAFSNWSQNG